MPEVSNAVVEVCNPCLAFHLNLDNLFRGQWDLAFSIVRVRLYRM